MLADDVLKVANEKDLLCEGAHIVLGLSGGPDSMCLFDVLCSLSPKMNLTIHPVHVNHLFRQGAAEEDQAYVERVSADAGFPCRSFVYPCSQIAAKEGMSPEEAGRNARYQAFAIVAAQAVQGLCEEGMSEEEAAGRVVIAVAQNAGDQCETILFRIMRGSGVDGLAGIAFKRYETLGNMIDHLPWGSWINAPQDVPRNRDDALYTDAKVAVVRPLLDTPRKEIEEYLRGRGIDARRDHTNKEPVYTRNKIRLELLPYMAENFNAAIEEAVTRLGKNAALDKDYLQGQAEEAFRHSLLRKAETDAPDKAAIGCEAFEKDRPENICEGCCDNRCGAEAGKINVEKERHRVNQKIEMSITALTEMHRAIRYRVYNIALKHVGLRENVTQAHINNIDSLLQSQSPSACTELPSGIAVTRHYDKLVFCAGEQTEAAPSCRIRCLKPDELLSYESADDVLQYGVFCMDESEDVSDLEVRTRRDGDYIHIKTQPRSEATAELQNGADCGFSRKKLQDLLVDEKVPKALRNNIWVLARGSRILWILPSPSFSRELLRKKGRFSAKEREDFLESEKHGFSKKTIFIIEILCQT